MQKAELNPKDAAPSSTGKAVFLSAVTVIGFISLVFTYMKPIQTVGIALSGGINCLHSNNVYGSQFNVAIRFT